MNRKIFALPVVVALAVLIGSQMFAPAQPQAQAPAWDVTTVDLPFTPVATPVVTPAIPPSDGAGYKPQADPKCECVNCNCGELEKRIDKIASELAVIQSRYGTARPAASNGSTGTTNYGSTGVSRIAGTPPLPYGSTLVSERVTATYEGVPQMQAAPRAAKPAPVRNAVKGVVRGTCRMVNGVLVGCN